MLGYDDLLPQRDIESALVQCPVLGCATRVPVQRRNFRRSSLYWCPVHRLFIGRSTFEYESDADNLLRRSAEDLELLAAIRTFKRESRMARERSEDALTWNVFRQLEVSGRLGHLLSTLTGVPAAQPTVHYWSFDAQNRATWAPLAEARSAFGELPGRGSEPDLVIATESAHIWLEAKFGSNNDTAPSDVTAAEARYTRGADNWYASVVASPFSTVAVEARRYELLRLWLLGTWAAQRRQKQFLLLNLVREGLEEEVPQFASCHFHQSPARRVVRVTWESLFQAIHSRPPYSAADSLLLEYMRGKTLGYDCRGRLLRAFELT
jgi:hypothetical protein